MGFGLMAVVFSGSWTFRGYFGNLENCCGPIGNREHAIGKLFLFFCFIILRPDVYVIRSHEVFDDGAPLYTGVSFYNRIWLLQNLFEVIKDAREIDPQKRINSLDILNAATRSSGYFSNDFIRTTLFIETMAAKDVLEKEQFFRFVFLDITRIRTSQYPGTSMGARWYKSE